MKELNDPKVTKCDDDSILLEWIGENARFGLVIDVEPEFSSWFYVHKYDEFGGAYGDLPAHIRVNKNKKHYIIMKKNRFNKTAFFKKQKQQNSMGLLMNARVSELIFSQKVKKQELSGGLALTFKQAHQGLDGNSSNFQSKSIYAQNRDPPLSNLSQWSN